MFSNALGMQTEVLVIIPQENSNSEIGVNSKAPGKKYKCLYLLHGLSDDYSIWLRRTSIERYASEYGICVVMPYAHKSFYSNLQGDLKYYDFIAKELPDLISDFFNVSDKREDNYIAGNSMGGYGALKIALRELDRFSAVAALSPVANIKRQDFYEITKTIFGENLNIPFEDDLCLLLKHVEQNHIKPRIYISIGKQDFMYEDNLKLKEVLKNSSYDYNFYEKDGEHSWAFWDNEIQRALEWLCKNN